MAINLKPLISQITPILRHFPPISPISLKRFLRTRRRKVLATSLAILILVTSFRLFLFLNPKEVKAATLSLSTTSTTVQIDVPNRYRVIMTTDNTDDYILISDRAENDSSPDNVVKVFGSAINDTSTWYTLRWDDSRKTTILESTPARVRVRVEGCYDTTGGGACIKDVAGGDDDVIQAIEEYTFTTEGIFATTEIDFKDGLGLASSDQVPSFSVGFNDINNNNVIAYSETVLYGDGETESSRSTSGSMDEDDDNYYVLQATGNYQDVIFGTMTLDGDKALSNSTNGGNSYNVDDADEQEAIDLKDPATQTLSGKGSAQFFIQFHAQNELNTEDEREAFFNDLTNPDYLSYTTGKRWDEQGGFFRDNFETGNLNAWDSTTTDGGDLSVTTAAGLAGTDYGLRANIDDTNIIYGDKNHTAPASGNLRVRFYVDPNTITIPSDTDFTIFTTPTGPSRPSNVWEIFHIYLGYSSGGNYYLVFAPQEDDDSPEWHQTNITDSPHFVEVHVERGAGDGRYRWWIDGVLQNTDSSQDNDGTYDSLREFFFGAPSSINSGTSGTIFLDELVVNDTGLPIGAASGFNEAEGAYTSDMSASDIEVDIDAGPNVSTLINDVTAVEAGATSITVDSTTGFPSSGVAYIEGDKFSYTGTTATTFTGIPSTGELSIIGHADNSVVSLSQRHTPLWKLRNYRKNDVPQTVTLEQSTLTHGSQYNAAIKPFTTSYFAQDLLWHSTLEDSSSVTSPDVGSAGTVSGATFTTGKYGNGLLADAVSEYIYAPIASNFDKAKGALEFWVKPNWNHTDNTQHNFFESWNDANNSIVFSKAANNDLQFSITASGTWIAYTITSANYSWNSGDWVHLRIEWDDSASTADQMKVFVNGVEPTHNDDSDDYNSANLTLPTNFYIPDSSASRNTNAVIDEFRIYDFNGSGDRAELAKLSVGGNTADADEYLADPTNNYTLDFNDDDASNRGEYVWLGSDSPYGGVNMDLATDGVGNMTIFSEDYEGGDMGEWDSTQDPDGDEIYASQASAFTGTYGMQVDIDDADWITAIEGASPPGSDELYYRFNFNPNSLIMDEGDEFEIFRVRLSGGLNVLQDIRLVFTGGNYYIRALVYYDDGWEATWDVQVTNAYHSVEVHVERATGVSASDGRVRWWIDGVLEDTASNVDIWDAFPLIDYFYAGAMDGVDAGTSGSIYFDDIVFRDGMMMDYDWEYWDGDSWSALTVTEQDVGSSSFTADGNFYFTPPSDWLPYSVNGSTDLYYIRGHLEESSYTTDPIESRIQTDVLLLHYQDKVIDENQTLKIPASSSGANPPVVYWNLDEGYGTTANDASGHGNSGTISGASWQEEGLCYSQKCLLFDGSNDEVTRTDDPEFDSDEVGSFTISAWIRHPDIATNPDVIAAKFESTGSDGGYRLQMESDGDISFGIDDENTSFPEDSVTSTTADYDDNRWHHLSAVKDANDNLFLYIDGNLIDTDATISATDSLDNNDDFYLGIDGDGASNAWAGFIDEFKFYRYARSADEIKADLVKGASVRGAQTSYGLRDYSYLSEGLVGYWKMDESSADTCGASNDSCDSSGNANDGAWTNQATSAAGKFGNGVTLDGTDDYVEVSSSSSLNLGASQGIAVSAWAKTDSTLFTRTILGKWSSSGGRQYKLSVITSSSNIYAAFEVSSNGTARATWRGDTALSANQWYHIVGIWKNNGTIEVYVNAVAQSLTDVTSSESIPTSLNPTTTRNVCVGTSNNSTSDNCATNIQDWSGPLDDIRIYNRALTPSEIRQLADWAPGPVGYWPMDEGSGTGTDAVNDRSGNANHGTMESSMTEDDWVAGKFGKALDFDGSDDDISITGGDGSLFDFDSLDFVISAWVKTTTDGVVINMGGATANDDMWALRVSSAGKAVFEYENGDSTHPTATSNTSVDDNKWHHLVGLRNGIRSAKIYVDGVLEDSQTLGSGLTAPNTTSNVQIGEPLFTTGFFTGFTNFTGIIDEVRVYNYARTPSQIIEDMNAGHPVGGSPLPSQIGYWRFDEGYGDTANDSGSGGNNGDLASSGTTCPQSGDSACPTWTNSGKFGKALDFDTAGTTDDYVDVADSDELDLTRWTLSVWVNFDTTSDTNFILEKGTDSDTYANYYLYRNSGGNLISGFRTTGGAWDDHSYAWTPTTGQWYHIEVTYDQSNYKIYLDGLQVFSEAESDTPLTGGGNLKIGSERSPAFYFNGQIDEVKIYNVALTADQVKLDMNQGKAAVWGATSTDSSGVGTWDAANEYCPPRSSGTCTAPVGEWKFDEGTGTSTTNDTSGNGNTGTLNGSMTQEDWVLGKKGWALDFDASNDHILVTDSGSISLTSTGTVEAWINSNREYPSDSASTNYRQVVNKWASGACSGTDEGYALDWYGTDSAATLRGLICNGTLTETVSYSTTLTPNTWNHVAFSWDGSNKYLYLNGRQVNSNSQNINNQDDTSDLRIGCGYTSSSCSSTNAWDGKIDNTRIYNYARTQAQVAWSYNRGGPVGWWRLDECSGTTANDAGSGGNNGTITIGSSGSNTSAGTCSSGDSTEAWNNGTTGKRNASLDFDGTDDYINAGSGNSLDITQSITVEGWFSIDSESANYMPVAKWDSNGSKFAYLVQIINSTPYFYINPAGAGVAAATSSENLNAGTWYHLAGTYDGDVIRIYVNGVETGINDITDAIIVSESSTPVYIGSGKNGASLNRAFAGQIDEVKIFNYALTQQQIRDNYNAGAAVRYGPATGSP